MHIHYIASLLCLAFSRTTKGLKRGEAQLDARCAAGAIPSGQYCDRTSGDVGRWLVACFTPDLRAIWTGEDIFGDPLPPHTRLKWPQRPDAAWLANLRAELVWSSVYPTPSPFTSSQRAYEGWQDRELKPSVDNRLRQFGIESYVARSCPRGYACVPGVSAHTGYVLCRLRPGRYPARGGRSEWLMPVDGDSTLPTTALDPRTATGVAAAGGEGKAVSQVGAYYNADVVWLSPGHFGENDGGTLVQPGVSAEHTVKITRHVMLPGGASAASAVSVVLYDPATMRVLHPKSVAITLSPAADGAARKSEHEHSQAKENDQHGGASPSDEDAHGTSEPICIADVSVGRPASAGSCTITTSRTAKAATASPTPAGILPGPRKVRRSLNDSASTSAAPNGTATPPAPAATATATAAAVATVGGREHWKVVLEVVLETIASVAVFATACFTVVVLVSSGAVSLDGVVRPPQVP